VTFAGFVDGHTPVPKRRKIAKEVTQYDLARLGMERRAQEAAEGLRKQEEERERCRQEEQLRREASETKLRCAMQDLRARGYPTLFSFINAFLDQRSHPLFSNLSDDWHPWPLPPCRLRNPSTRDRARLGHFNSSQTGRYRMHGTRKPFRLLPPNSRLHTREAVSRLVRRTWYNR